MIETNGESSDVTAGLAMDWIGKVAKGKKPFLAVVWFGNPHSPHVAVDKFKKMYSDQPDGVAHFYGEITAMDAALGKMRSGLRKLGIADNTVLWYCSDNGSLPKGSSGGLRARKGSLYEGGIRVPAVLEWPARVKANRITDINANTSDIYPTLLELAGVALLKTSRDSTASASPRCFAGKNRCANSRWDSGRITTAGMAATPAECLRRCDRSSSTATSNRPHPRDRSGTFTRPTICPATPPGSRVTTSCTAFR